VIVDLLKGYFRPSAPLSIAVLFGVGVVWLYCRPSSRGPRRYFALLVLGYWLAATATGGEIASFALARGLAPIHGVEEAGGADVVVVLGGGARTFSEDDLVVGVLSNSSILRALEGARVAKLIGARLVIASGGIPTSQRRRQRKPESEMIRNMLVEAGVPPDRVIQETDSRNTRDEARLVRSMLGSRGVQRFVLVTSAMHMRRSLAVFRAHGLHPVASAAPMRSDDTAGTSWWLPNSDSLTLVDESIYEYAASLYYWWEGWYQAPQ
jgi:uncharacterized SAM-binding protein YcdF (DUF218 family)